MKETKNQDPPIVGIGDGLQTSIWIKSNGARENKVLLFKGKVENFANLQSLP